LGSQTNLQLALFINDEMVRKMSFQADTRVEKLFREFFAPLSKIISYILKVIHDAQRCEIQTDWISFLSEAR
jgi:hypothetical protein